MSEPKRLITEFTSTEATGRIISAGVREFVRRTGENGPLTRLTSDEIDAVVGVAFYALGEVLERQFYPSDREQCQEVARWFHERAGFPVAEGTIMPDGKIVPVA
jgi:hypothetical protein